MFRSVAWVAFLVSVSACLANAQSNYGTLRGSVSDPQHLAIPGHVQITSSSPPVPCERSPPTPRGYVADGLQPGATNHHRKEWLCSEDAIAAA